MHTQGFFEAIADLVVEPSSVRLLIEERLRRRGHLKSRDPCPDVSGMASWRKLKLLDTAVSSLPGGGEECYFEIGSYQGKSLIAALAGNAGARAVACDNFSLFDDADDPQNAKLLRRNLARYGLTDRVAVFDCDYRELLARWPEEGLVPAGVYFVDGPHDEENQYLAIKLAEPILADEAAVIVDDWRFAGDSRSYAEAGTRRALAESVHDWEVEHVLPARRNGDLELWWNGVAVLRFRRRASRPR